MSDRIIPALSVSCGLLTAVYLTLVVTTVFYAAWQTQATSSVRDNESKIATLESSYYATMEHISSMNPAAAGFITPKDVVYVAQVGDTASDLSFASK